MNKQEFINAGFSVVDGQNNENKLLKFLKENYPSVIKDNEIILQELKAILGLPVDEKVNGYGLNFVGRNVARAKYAQKTQKELKLNTKMSKNIDTTQNLVLKGDNIDCLKILKNHYSGKIKCIYIDPPYNTDSDEFVYPDKFDKEEAEVLGLVNLSEDDFARMEFSFKTKKSHNGWLSFMYPRLLLARDLLSKDGVIFISIDDNEQANLKLLCDEIFGEENFVANIIWNSRKSVSNDTIVSLNHNHTLFFSKDISFLQENKSDYRLSATEDKFSNPDNDPRGNWVADPFDAPNIRPNLTYPIENPNTKEIYMPPKGRCWRTTKEEYEKLLSEGRIVFGKTGKSKPQLKRYFSEAEQKGLVAKSIWDDVGTTTNGTKELEGIIGEKVFDNPKPISFISRIIEIATSQNSIILDFFAGSGTTGHAVMQLNAKDGGNRKFILCQIDEPIKEDKPAYKFCIENNLPPVISSITIERLKRAGEKIVKDVEAENSKNELFEEDKKQVPDIGFKTFDLVDAPKLEVDDTGQIKFPELSNDALSRIYNMIFTVGLDEPTQVPEEVKKDCIYKIGNHYYLTNSEQISKEEFAECIKNGKVFIDGWTASLNGTLLNYKEDVKIVF
ncbi:MAG: site-specific DNA-methyltransferase [Bacteroidales bacterium]|nr:site-specific DNA-methyltransferase [Bacteroidales bacterium]